ncbi:MAG: hypothetical protein JO156_01805 [Solirubrobacterales bacterium]|nr:hypothetical protein [Solirubrobacterales bacterium]
MVLNDLDREVLRFAAAHCLVAPDHVSALTSAPIAEAGARMVRLAANGLLVRDRLAAAGWGCFRITCAGLRAVASGLPPPRLTRCHRHDVGVPWVWLAARDGVFGSIDRVLCEREMRGALSDVDAPFEVQPDGEHGHFPDVMLLTRSGRIPVELPLAAPAAEQLAAILRAYAADARVVAVLYLVVDPWVGELVQSVVGQLELTQLVHVQPARFGSELPSPGDD